MAFPRLSSPFYLEGPEGHIKLRPLLTLQKLYLVHSFEDKYRSAKWYLPEDQGTKRYVSVWESGMHLSAPRKIRRDHVTNNFSPCPRVLRTKAIPHQNLGHKRTGLLPKVGSILGNAFHLSRPMSIWNRFRTRTTNEANIPRQLQERTRILFQEESL